MDIFKRKLLLQRKPGTDSVIEFLELACWFSTYFFYKQDGMLSLTSRKDLYRVGYVSHIKFSSLLQQSSFH